MEGKISVYSGYFFDQTPEMVGLLFEKKGFDRFDLSVPTAIQLFNKKDIGGIADIGKWYKSYLADIGVALNQGHLLFKGIELSAIDPFADVDIIKKWIELYQYIGISRMVLHISEIEDGLNKDELLDRRINVLKVIAKEVNRDCYICVENLPNTLRSSNEMIELLIGVDDDRIMSCYDTGHLNLAKKSFKYNETECEYITKLGKYIKAVHINDNNGFLDEHLLPRIENDEKNDNRINLGIISKTLCEVGFDGDFNFEIPGEAQISLDKRLKKLDLVKEISKYYLEKR